jgi:hypothetical protein
LKRFGLLLKGWGNVLKRCLPKLLGAIAGGFVSPDARECAHNAGFFVLELTGETVKLVKPPKDFVAKEW